MNNEYNLEFFDVSDIIDYSNVFDPFHRINLRKFWDWNYLDCVHYNWDTFASSEFAIKTHMYDESFARLESAIINKTIGYSKVFQPNGVVGPLHYKVHKDNQLAYVSFGYMKYPGVYEQFFNFIIPTPYDDDNKWILSGQYDRQGGEFLDSIGRPIHTYLATVPEKSPMMRWIRMRKAFTATSVMDNPKVPGSKFVMMDCNWSWDSSEG